MENAVLERVRTVVKAKADSVSEFAKIVGVNQKTLSQYLNEERKLSLSLIQRIISSFEDVSIGWLLTGKGEMFRSNSSDITLSSSGLIKEKEEIIETRPHIPLTAAAGRLSEALDGVAEYECEQVPVVRSFQKYDFTITIHGDSMFPKYESGDTVACIRIKNSAFLQWGRVHILDTTQGIIMKRIYEDGDKIRCVSFNPEYPDILIPKNEIFSISLVIGQLRM